MEKRRFIIGSLLLLALCVSGCSFSLDGGSSRASRVKSSSTENSDSGDETTLEEENSSSASPSQSSSSNKTSSSSSSKSSSESSASSTSIPPAQGSFTFNDSQLNTPQEIHSASQKQYLNYSGSYYHITASELTSMGATGTANNSAPNTVTVSWNYTAPSGKSVSNYNFVYGQKADLSDGYQLPNTTSSSSISFYNAYLGDNYFRVIANLNDGSKDYSDIKVFKVDTQAPRNLKVGNMPNVRDMGSRTTYAGGKIRQGLIYRTAGNKFDKNTAVDNDCKTTLTNQLKVKTEINVADSTTYNVNLTGVNLINCYMDYGRETTVSGYSQKVGMPYSNMSRNAEKIRQVLDVFADESNYPIFYHCRIGTDRTGITGITLGGLLGIPFNEIIQDYGFSNFAPIDGQRYTNKTEDKNGDDPAKYIDEILKMPGKNFQEKTHNALLTIGVSSQTINNIINIMTEGTKAVLPSGANIGSGDSLNSTATKQTKSDYTAPASYYPITNGGSVSYQVNVTAGEKDVVVYLGSTESSNTTNFSSGISFKIDGTDKSFEDKTMFKAGFGSAGSGTSARTAYMFQWLGKYSLTAGQHTFSINAKSSVTFNVASICVFDHVDSVESI